MKTSRQRLLDWIELHRVATAPEISVGLQMSQNTARHHLKILEEQGIVEVVGVRLVEGVGRPAKLYAPARGVFSHSLDHLAQALLAQGAAQTTGDGFESFLKGAAERLASPDGSPVGQARRSRHLTQRLGETVQRLNELHYAARWEAHANAPRIIFHHCPYASIIDQHPEICRVDAALLEKLLGQPVDLVTRREPDERGARFCIFALNL